MNAGTFVGLYLVRAGFTLRPFLKYLGFISSFKHLYFLYPASTPIPTQTIKSVIFNVSFSSYTHHNILFYLENDVATWKNYMSSVLLGRYGLSTLESWVSPSMAVLPCDHIIS